MDGIRSFVFEDTITITCAMGYYFNGTDRLISISASCLDNGQWSVDTKKLKCIGMFFVSLLMSNEQNKG